MFKFNYLNTISNNYDSLVKNLNDLSIHFKNLKEMYKFNGKISEGFELIKEISLNYSNGFLIERDFIRNELKFFFNTWKKKIEDSIWFKSTKDSYLAMFNKVNRMNLRLAKEIVKIMKNRDEFIKNLMLIYKFNINFNLFLFIYNFF